MYTSLMFIALSVHATQLAIVTPAPNWQADYCAAWKKGKVEQKPLAIVFGSGPIGWQDLVKEGALDKDTRELLNRHYLSVYIDITTEKGKQWADKFELKAGPALVLSDRTLESQSYRHVGTLANTELVTSLNRFGPPPTPAPTPAPAPIAVRPQYNFAQYNSYPSFSRMGNYCPT